jgi:hypothetical protein
MENKKTEQRVVLNLSMDQARGIIELLDLALNETIQTPRRELGMSIKNRVQKTITKHETSNHCKYCGNLSEGEYCTPNCAGLDEKENGVTQ